MREMRWCAVRTGVSTLAVGAAALAIPGAVHAQAESPQVRSNPAGFHLTGGLGGAAITTDDTDEAESGGGAFLGLGWGFSRTVTLYLRAAGASIRPDFGDPYGLGHADLGLRFHFGGPDAGWLAYGDVAMTGLAATFDLGGADLDVSGTGFTAGGGLLHFFSPSLALDLGLRLTFGELTEAEAGGVTAAIELGTTTGRFDVGLSWWAG